MTLRADSSPHSTVVTCTHCPSFRLVAATRDAAIREALPHAASHDEQRAARELLRYRPGRR